MAGEKISDKEPTRKLSYIPPKLTIHRVRAEIGIFPIYARGLALYIHGLGD